MTRLVLLIVLGTALLTPARATDVVPPAAVEAEMEQRWEDALRAYHDIVRAWPDRVDIWLRIADVHAVQKQYSEAADALGKAVKHRPDDARLLARWSQALAVANQPNDALRAMQRAVAIEPENTDYLAAEAQLALWSGQEVLAEESYRRWLARTPGDATPLRRWAQLVARHGDLERAVEMYEACLDAPLPDPAVRLDLAQVHAYRGDFSAARRELSYYLKSEGADPRQYSRSLADLEARAGNPRAALDRLEPLLAEDPDDYELQLVNANARHADMDPAGAVKALGELQRLGPDRPETDGMLLQVETPLRTAVSGSAGYYADSLDLQQVRYLARVGTQSGPRVRWTFEAERIDTSAELGSGLATSEDELNPSSPRSEVAVDRLNLAGRFQANPVFGFEAGAGVYRPEDADSVVAYQAGIALRPVDGLRVRLRAERDLLLVSPRAIASHVERQRGRVLVNAQLGDRFFMDLEGNRDLYSDDNESIEALVGPRFAVARNQYFNLDLGARAHVIKHDFDLVNSEHALNGGSGYYSPELFRRYWATAFFYGKLRDSAGIGIAAGYGLEQDRDLDSAFRRAGDVSVEGTFGIYADWQLRIWGGAGGRVDSAGFQAASYHGRSAGLEITRRF